MNWNNWRILKPAPRIAKNRSVFSVTKTSTIVEFARIAVAPTIQSTARPQVYELTPKPSLRACPLAHTLGVLGQELAFVQPGLVASFGESRTQVYIYVPRTCSVTEGKLALSIQLGCHMAKPRATLNKSYS
jgi:hypothetical protein